MTLTAVCRKANEHFELQMGNVSKLDIGVLSVVFDSRADEACITCRLRRPKRYLCRPQNTDCRGHDLHNLKKTARSPSTVTACLLLGTLASRLTAFIQNLYRDTEQLQSLFEVFFKLGMHRLLHSLCLGHKCFGSTLKPVVQTTTTLALKSHTRKLRHDNHGVLCERGCLVGAQRVYSGKFRSTVEQPSDT